MHYRHLLPVFYQNKLYSVTFLMIRRPPRSTRIQFDCIVNYILFLQWGTLCFMMRLSERSLLVQEVIIPLKKAIMFFTSPLDLSVCVCLCVCVCVCLSVCHHVYSEMAGLSNMVSSEVNTIYKNLKMQH